MTDAEIIKALECHTGVYKGAGCMHCAFTNYGCDCLKKLNEASLDLINRQKAEIERLTINMNAFGLGMKREKERADTAREEAMKEFAERFLSIAQRVDRDDVDELILIKRDLFDSFVKKEMAGDTECTNPRL